MIVKKLRKQDMGKFLKILSREYKVMGPVRDRAVFSYAEIDDASRLALDHPRTVVPVKRFLHPERDTMFELKKGEFRETVPDERHALLGLHICDINAIARLDIAMAGDPYYRARREGALVVGMTCKPTEECFCKSMKADALPPGVCDLFMMEDADGYLVVPGTEKGRRLSGATLFQTTERTVERIAVEYEEKKHIDVDRVSRNFIKNHQNPLWDEMAKQCLGCTNCTTTCPLCYCYDVADRTAVTPENPVRERFWDSCTLLNFATVAGGHRFRPDLKARYKNIYTHKFRGFVDEFGLPACVGCGRCTSFCPAGIDMRRNLERLEVG